MKHYKICETNVFIHYIEEYNLVNIRLESKFGIECLFSIKTDSFINFLSSFEIVQVEDGFILWDEYIEDDGETTRHNQHVITLKDYVSNYISSYDLEKILEGILYGTLHFLNIRLNNTK